jgi:thiazole tautomerase (transcriptional regulator TenI)
VQPRPPIPLIHAVTSDEIASRPGFLERATSVMRALGPRGAVHLRTHRLSAAEIHSLAGRLAEIQDESGCWLVINDRVDVALATGARAIQLTSRSMPIPDALAVAPTLLVGASVHSAAEAETAERDGAAWTIAGQVFAADGQPGQPGRGEAFITEVSDHTTLPVIAIGGVRPEHVRALRDAGAWGVAVIRGIWAAADAEAAATDYLSRYDADGGS